MIMTETPEEETLNKIKFVLFCGNDAQAIRLLEQYSQWQQERSYSEKDLLSFGTFIRIEDRKEKRLFLIQDYYKKWLEQFKKK